MNPGSPRMRPLRNSYGALEREDARVPCSLGGRDPEGVFNSCWV